MLKFYLLLVATFCLGVHSEVQIGSPRARASLEICMKEAGIPPEEHLQRFDTDVRAQLGHTMALIKENKAFARCFVARGLMTVANGLNENVTKE